MRNLFTIMFLLFSCVAIQAQDKILEELKTLSEQQQFSEITSKYSEKYDTYSSEAFYYVAFAYYMQEEDIQCLKFLNLALEKDSQNVSALYIKGSTLNYMLRYDEAILVYKRAIEIEKESSQLYSGLGDSYEALGKYEDALEAYKKVIELDDNSVNAHRNIASIYLILNRLEESLNAYYSTISKLTPDSEDYKDVLFNVGLLEMMNKKYDKAIITYQGLIEKFPKDFHSCAKLIQLYYRNAEYDKIDSLKEVLYNAHSKGELVDSNLEDMFCIDQFDWRNHKVMVFERYETGNSENIYNKHLFYIQDDKKEVLFRVQTEFSPMSVSLGGQDYLLCATLSNNNRFNSGIGFSHGYKYEYLKAVVLPLLDKFENE